METVVLTGDLVRQGWSRDEIARLCRRGELEPLRRGAYVRKESAALDASARHRQLIEATLPLLSSDAVVSYVSAAVLHGLPVWDDDLTSVHLTRPRTAGGGQRRSLVTLHGQALEPADVTEIDGVGVTTLARTVFDIARVLPFDRAVAAGDQAMALGMSTDLLVQMLERGRRWKGARQAQRVAAFIDGRAESAGESVSRVRCLEFGLPRPELQLPIALADGTTAYADFAWPDLCTVGEFDGRVKYEKLRRVGESSADVVIREKRREDELRSLGWQVVRWIWSELHHFGLVRNRLLRAFDRAAPLQMHELVDVARSRGRATSTY